MNIYIPKCVIKFILSLILLIIAIKIFTFPVVLIVCLGYCVIKGKILMNKKIKDKNNENLEEENINY